MSLASRARQEDHFSNLRTPAYTDRNRSRTCVWMNHNRNPYQAVNSSGCILQSRMLFKAGAEPAVTVSGHCPYRCAIPGEDKSVEIDQTELYRVTQEKLIKDLKSFENGCSAVGGEGLRFSMSSATVIFSMGSALSSGLSGFLTFLSEAYGHAAGSCLRTTSTAGQRNHRKYPHLEYHPDQNLK